MSFHTCNTRSPFTGKRETSFSSPISTSKNSQSSSHLHKRLLFILTTAFLRTALQIQLVLLRIFLNHTDLFWIQYKMVRCNVPWDVTCPQIYTYLHEGGIAHQQGCVLDHQIREHIQRNIQLCFISTADVSDQSTYNLLRKDPKESLQWNISGEMPVLLRLPLRSTHISIRIKYRQQSWNSAI